MIVLVSVVLASLVAFLLGFVIFRRFFIHYMFPVISCPVYMGGKTAVITGGSSGLGYHIALELASRGCKVIVADVVSDESIRDEMIRKTNNHNIFIYHMDLTSFKSVREFAKKLKKSEYKIDILINHAGLGGSDDTLTEDGLNFVYQTNLYGGFLLTHLLLDLLRKSKSARVIFTSSIAAYTNFLNKFDRQQITTRASIKNYFSSKCLIIIISDMFSNLLKKYNITCNTWHPFLCNTPNYRRTLNKCSQGGQQWVVYLLWAGAIFLAPKAARVVLRAVQLACANEMEGVSGEFFGTSGKAYKPYITKDPEFSQQVWDLAEKVVNLKPTEKI